MRLFKQLAVVFAVLALAAMAGLLFTFDVIKIDWVSFMEIQPSFRAAELPLPVPARSVPVEGPAYVFDQAGNVIVPDNPVPADEDSIARGAIFYDINCKMCHGPVGNGKGPLAAFLVEVKPADLTSALVTNQADGELFLTLTNGKGMMPYFIENLSVRDRWDVVNFIRTLEPAQ
ncbi:MAG: c-type cytochrome [Chloroflexota bacterium]